MIEIKLLSADSKFLSSYVRLKNRYSKELLAPKITLYETKKWLNRKDVKILVAIKKNIVIAAAVLFVFRNNELAIFTKYRSRGLASKLFNILENSVNKLSIKVDIQNKKSLLFFRRKKYFINTHHKSFYKGMKVKTVMLSKKTI